MKSLSELVLTIQANERAKFRKAWNNLPRKARLSMKAYGVFSKGTQPYYTGYLRGLYDVDALSMETYCYLMAFITLYPTDRLLQQELKYAPLDSDVGPDVIYQDN